MFLVGILIWSVQSGMLCVVIKLEKERFTRDMVKISLLTENLAT